MVHLLGERGRGLPDYVAEQVAEFLRIERCGAGLLEVVGSSSSRGDFPLSAVLDPDPCSWWISAAGSFQRGAGKEWLEFVFRKEPCRAEVRRRVSFLGIKIPAMPSGPLSVRKFHLMALLPGCEAGQSGSWVQATRELSTADVGHLQEFALAPPLETSRVRLVCTSNAVSSHGAISIDCVGLFEVRFA